MVLPWLLLLCITLPFSNLPLPGTPAPLPGTPTPLSQVLSPPSPSPSPMSSKPPFSCAQTLHACTLTSRFSHRFSSPPSPLSRKYSKCISLPYANSLQQVAPDAPVSRMIMVSVDEILGINWFGELMPPYWRRNMPVGSVTPPIEMLEAGFGYFELASSFLKKSTALTPNVGTPFLTASWVLCPHS